MLVIDILLIRHEVCARSRPKLHLGPNFVMLAGVLGVLPVVLMEHCIRAHRHVVMSDVELVHWVIISSIETHSGHIVFRDVHFV